MTTEELDLKLADYEAAIASIDADKHPVKPWDKNTRAWRRNGLVIKRNELLRQRARMAVKA